MCGLLKLRDCVHLFEQSLTISSQFIDQRGDQEK